MKFLGAFDEVEESKSFVLGSLNQVPEEPWTVVGRRGVAGLVSWARELEVVRQRVNLRRQG